MPEKAKIRVELIQHNAEAEKIAALAAKLCYTASGVEELRSKIENSEQADFIEKIISMGHLSVIEHISFTFAAEGISRALTHQLVRHRIASYSQKSQRYAAQSGGFPFIVPPSVEKNGKALRIYDKLMREIASAYDALEAADIPREDARYVLPNACETKIIITMNARELTHFFSLRSCNRAQWEIRELSDKMLALCFQAAPAVFKNAGPGCVRKGCTEGKFTCGKAAEVKKRIKDLKNNAETASDN